MSAITTCPKCGALYEESSEEQANAPGRECGTCYLARSDEDPPGDRCTDPRGHKFECTGTAYGGDDERWHGEGRCLCVYCGADGDA